MSRFFIAMKKKSFKDTPETLKKAILEMQEKIISEEGRLINEPLMLEVEKGDGNTVNRANPYVQEYRALVKDYGAALRTYNELYGSEEAEPDDKLADIRSRLKVIA